MKKVKYLIIPLLVLMTILTTYSIFKSAKTGSASVQTANWKVKVIANSTTTNIIGYDQEINLGDCEKLFPGGSCEIPFTIDMTDSEVDSVLTVSISDNITGATKQQLRAAGIELRVRDGEDEYYTYLLNYGTSKNLKLVINWEAGDEDNDIKAAADVEISKLINSITLPINMVIRQRTDNIKTVRFNTHDSNIEAPNNIEVTDGNVINNIPQVEKNGYIFLGWYTSEIGGVKLTTLTPIVDNVEYHARFRIKEDKTITFNSNEGSNINPIVILEGSTLNDIPEPTKLGYTFTGWFDNNNNQLTISTIINDDVTYIAEWEEKILTITFNSDGGSNVSSIDIQEGKSLSDLNMTLPISTKFGYTLVGWFDNNELTENTQIMENKTYTASWSAKYYTITFNSDGGNNVGSMQVQEGESLSSSSIDLPIPTKEGYTFYGWFNNNDELTELTQILNNVTYTATWELNYSITYNLNGGSMSGEKTTYTIRDIYTLPRPTKDGYIFNGWTGSNGSSPEARVIISNTTGNKFYTAVWSQALEGALRLYSPNDTNVTYTYDSNTKIYTITQKGGSTGWGSGVICDGAGTAIPWGYTYILQFDIYVPRSEALRLDTNAMFDDGTGNDEYGTARFYLSSGDYATNSSLPAGEWITAALYMVNDNETRNPNHKTLYSYSAFGFNLVNSSSNFTYQVKNLTVSSVDLR